jgi:flagellar biosynthesis/type III secretory pathway protein FliH
MSDQLATGIHAATDKATAELAIEKLLDAARESARKAGFDEGFDKGRDEGEDTGLERGRAEGAREALGELQEFEARYCIDALRKLDSDSACPFKSRAFMKLADALEHA